MKYSAKEVIQYVEENDVKFVKLTFCDIFGGHKNVSIMTPQLPEIFKNGHLFDSSAVPGVAVNTGDLLLFPDPKTLTVLPWRPQAGAVVSMISYIKRPDGTFFEGDALHLLDVANSALYKLGLSCEIGTECDFYVFKQDGNGNPTNIPVDRAGYLDSAPDDACENLRRDIILNLEDMGIVPTSSHHERGPGQNEIEFVPTETASAARNFVFFKSAVCNVSYMSGLHATFNPKPIDGAIGSGLRITVTLGGVGDAEVPTATLDAFREGVFTKAPEMIAFLNSTVKSYELFGEMRAPAYGTDSNRYAYISALPAENGACRIEINAADCVGNPFLCFALILQAGLYGIQKGLKKEEGKYFVSCTELPRTLKEALDIAQKSKWLRSVLSDGILDEYIRIKRAQLK